MPAKLFPSAAVRTACLTALALGAVAATLVSPAAADVKSAPLPATTAVPKVYVIPMKGQLGTDVSKSIYEEMIKDIEKVKPDILVYEVKLTPISGPSYLANPGDREKQQDAAELLQPGDIRDLVKTLREDLAAYPQVMWVDDAVGFSSMMVLAWPDLYMTPTAKLGGVGGLIPNIKKRWQDEDVRAKMVAAWAGILKGLAEQGGRALELGDAMLFPEAMLSASFDGREVKFRSDAEGIWVIDSRPDWAANFSAAVAEDCGLANGLAESLDDLMFLLGYREYQKVDSGVQLFEEYTKDWRKAFESAKKKFEDAQIAMSEGGDEDNPAAGFGKARRLLDEILAIMKRYPAVEIRFQQAGLPGKSQIEIMMEQLAEQIRALKNGQRGNTPGGRGGGGRGAPGSGPGSR